MAGRRLLFDFFFFSVDFKSFSAPVNERLLDKAAHALDFNHQKLLLMSCTYPWLDRSSHSKEHTPGRNDGVPDRGDNNTHQPIVETFDAYDRFMRIFRSHESDISGGPDIS